MRLGYLIAQYPALSHTFILREVRVLRQAGFDIRTVSVRPADRPGAALSPEERDELRQTFSVIGAGAAHAIGVHLRVVLRRPAGYLRGLLFAWALSGGTPRRVVSHTLYFLEAVVAGEYFRRQGVAFVHTHFSSTVLLILARVFPIRYSMTVHGSDEFVDVAGFHMARKVAAAAFVATISQYGASQVMKPSDPRDWHKVFVARLGVDPRSFDPGAGRPRVPGAAFRLLSVGRLSPPKAYQMLIEAVFRLRQRGCRLELTLVGEGPSRAGLERLIAERGLGAVVHLAGARSPDEVREFYRQSDAFALSSFAEGVPVVLMEAMAMELPCVATWITGIPELIDAETDGLLVPPASPDALADAIRRLIDDPELARRLGRAARRKILAKYDLEANVRGLRDLFLGQAATG